MRAGVMRAHLQDRPCEELREQDASARKRGWWVQDEEQIGMTVLAVDERTSSSPELKQLFGSRALPRPRRNDRTSNA